MRNEEKERILETCIEQVKSGEDIESVLAMYPEWANELRSPLEAAQAVRWLASTSQMPADVMDRDRERFLQAVEISRRTASRRQYRSATKRAPRSRPTDHTALFSGFRLVFAGLALIVIVLIGAGTSLTASARALPGEPLYPFKIASEDVRLWFERDPVRRIDLENSFDQKRFDEVKTLVDRSRQETVVQPVAVQFSGPLILMQSGNWKINDIVVVVKPDTQLIGQLEPGYVVDVKGELQPDGSVVAKRIALRQIRVEGLLRQDEEGQWKVGGVPFRLSQRTQINGTLLEGSQADVILVQTLDGTFEAWSVRIKQDEQQDRSGGDLQDDPVLQETDTPDSQNDDLSNPAEPSKENSDSEGEDDHDKTPQPTKQDEDDGDDRTRTPEPTSDEEDSSDRPITTPEHTKEVDD